MNIDAEEHRIFARFFTKIWAEIIDGLIFDYYTKHSTHALEAHVSLVKRDAILDRPQYGKKWASPVEALLGIESIDVVRKIIDNQRSPDVPW